ncbi:unnamed protein product, partial [Tetraodon nigroviridis]
RCAMEKVEKRQADLANVTPSQAIRKIGESITALLHSLRAKTRACFAGHCHGPDSGRCSGSQLMPAFLLASISFSPTLPLTIFPSLGPSIVLLSSSQRGTKTEEQSVDIGVGPNMSSTWLRGGNESQEKQPGSKSDTRLVCRTKPNKNSILNSI